MDDEDATTDSEGDLNIVQSTSRKLGLESGRRNAPQPTTLQEFLTDSEQQSSDEGWSRSPRPQKKQRISRHRSSSSDSDLYKVDSPRKRAPRKKAKVPTRGRKAKEEGRSLFPPSRDVAPETSGRPGRPRKRPEWGEASESEELDECIPEYLRNRRARFDARVEQMREIGLRLPPDYGDVDFSDDERMADLVERPHFDRGELTGTYRDISLPKSLGIIPAPIAQWLRDYQVAGTEFLHTLFVYQTGGILGDDMGLGKTVQVIAFLTAAFGKTADERDKKRMRKMRRLGSSWYPKVLIVCPGTLIENWRDELERWGWWHIAVYHGNANAREEALQAAAMGRVEILITTYTTYRMNKNAINMVEWDCVVADECHQIKGRKSETTVAMNEVNALCRIGLTGTAIQNSYDELWTLLNWTNPGRFGPVTTWKRSISDPLRQGQSHLATHYELSKARKTAKLLVENLLPQFFLRRMKTLIADQLPKKSDRVVFCPLTDIQADAYENLLDSDVIRFIRESTETCNCGSGKKLGWCCQTLLPDGSKWQSHVFPSIFNLQRLSNHLATLIPQSSDAKDKQHRDLDILTQAVPDRWRELYRTRDSIMNYSNPEFCGKWKVLRKLLSFWHLNGDKVLVFSHSVRLLRMLQMLFQHTTYTVSYLDGAMSYQDRAHIVADFNSDPNQFVFLISTRAGGVGLNITSANKVVVVDPNWNPAYDLQAQDRAYRIGQVRDVEVFRLVSAGTIEEVVYARQIYKQQQANIGYTASTERRYFQGVQENKDQKGEIFGLANLFNYQHDNLLLRDIVNKTNVAESKAGVDIVGFDLDETDSSGLPFGSNDTDAHLPDADPGEEKALSQLAALIVSQAEEEAAPDKADSSKQKARAQKVAAVKRSADPIAAILATVGVEYTHENSEVVGPSRVEADLSRRAVEMGAGGYNPEFGESKVFVRGSSQRQTMGRGSRSRAGDPFADDEDAIEEDSPDEDNDNDDLDVQDGGSRAGNPSAAHGAAGRNPRHLLTASNDSPIASSTTRAQSISAAAIAAAANAAAGGKISYRYHPSAAIRKRHFCSMAEHFGFTVNDKGGDNSHGGGDRDGGDSKGDITAFALLVESWTQEQRRICLEKFYRARRRLVDGGKASGIGWKDGFDRDGNGDKGKREGPKAEKETANVSPPKSRLRDDNHGRPNNDGNGHDDNDNDNDRNDNENNHHHHHHHHDGFSTNTNTNSNVVNGDTDTLTPTPPGVPVETDVEDRTSNGKTHGEGDWEL